MGNKLERYFELLKLDENEKSHFGCATLKNVVVVLEESCWEIYIELPTMIDVEIYKIICEKVKNIDVESLKKVEYFFKHDSLDKLSDYFFYVFNKYQEDSPLLRSIKDENIKVEGSTITIEVANIKEQEKVEEKKAKILSFMSNMGYTNIQMNIEINETLSEEAKELIKPKEVPVELIEVKESSVILGNEIKNKKIGDNFF